MRGKVQRIVLSLACLAIIAGCGFYVYDWIQKNKEKESPQRKAVGPITTTPGDPEKCLSGIRQISLAMCQYALDNKDRFPAKLSLLYPSYASAPILFVCPGRKNVKIDRSKPETEVRKKIDEMHDYKMIPGVNLSSPQHWITVYCDANTHEGNVIVCFRSGGSKEMTKKEFEDYMKRQIAEMRRSK